MRNHIVFIHAFPLSGKMWDSQVQVARNLGFDVWAPDLPGFGGRKPSKPDLEAWALEILDGCKKRGIGKAIFAGLSMGGYVVFRICALAKDKVAGLVLADTRASADTEAARQRRDYLVQKVRDEGLGFLADQILPTLLGETSFAERSDLVESIRRQILEADPNGIVQALLAMRDRPDSEPMLSTLGMPALVVVGEEDRLTPPEEAKLLASKLPNARLCLIPKAGHLSNLENPGAFNEALTAFLKESGQVV